MPDPTVSFERIRRNLLIPSKQSPGKAISGFDNTLLAWLKPASTLGCHKLSQRRAAFKTSHELLNDVWISEGAGHDKPQRSAQAKRGEFAGQ